jgi:hypothetical protein
METCLQPREVVLDFGLLPLQVLCPQLETVAGVQVAHRSLAAMATTGDHGNSKLQPLPGMREPMTGKSVLVMHPIPHPCCLIIALNASCTTGAVMCPLQSLAEPTCHGHLDLAGSNLIMLHVHLSPAAEFVACSAIASVLDLSEQQCRLLLDTLAAVGGSSRVQAQGLEPLVNLHQLSLFLLAQIYGREAHRCGQRIAADTVCKLINLAWLIGFLGCSSPSVGM